MMSADFKFAGNMPDVTQADPISVHTSDDHTMELLENLRPIADRVCGEAYGLRFLYVMVVLDKRTTKPCMFVTLESSGLEDPFLCIFQQSGMHVNLGDGELYTDRKAFEDKAIELVCEQLNIDTSNIHKNTNCRIENEMVGGGE